MLNAAVTATSLLIVAALTLAPTKGQESADLVSLDIAVVDDKGRSVTGLTAADFQIKDDGRPVSIATFSEATPADPDVIRSLVLLMDDVAVPIIGNETMRTVARAILGTVNAKDEVAVVRLSSRSDEPFGDRAESLFRINNFRPGLYPYSDINTQRDVLQRITGIARQIESIDVRRKIIICIGSPAVCNIQEPSRSWPRDLYPSWVEAMTATARANVALYAIIPGRALLRIGGLAYHTGGEVFVSSYDVGPAIDFIVNDANHYYLAGYWPTGAVRELHNIEVKVARKGVKVRARRKRGG